MKKVTFLLKIIIILIIILIIKMLISDLMLKRHNELLIESSARIEFIRNYCLE
jgi:uncharacterized alpha/beta hydrolase family protein